eukprot:gene14360-biopygen8093
MGPTECPTARSTGAPQAAAPPPNVRRKGTSRHRWQLAGVHTSASSRGVRTVSSASPPTASGKRTRCEAHLPEKDRWCGWKGLEQTQTKVQARAQGPVPKIIT